MRLLIFGPGVIGSLYASLFAEAGFDTTVYARGAELENLRRKGRLFLKKKKVKKEKVPVCSDLKIIKEINFFFLKFERNRLYQEFEK